MGQSLSRAIEGSVLAEAAANNESGVVTQVVEACPRALLYKTLFKRRTPLMLAAEHGSVESLLKLLWGAERLLGTAFQAHIDETDGKGNTALILASKHGNVACVRLLLEDMASPLPANSRGDTALHLAAHVGSALCVDLLLRAWVRRPSGSPVRAADAMVADGDGFGEERFVDTHNKAGLAALHLAVLAGSVEAAAVLVRGGASPDVPVVRGMQLRVPYLCSGSTPLHIAAYQGDIRMCLVLLDTQWRQPGVELRRMRNARGLTPLNCALLAGHHDLARVLVEAPTSRVPTIALSRRALDYQFPQGLRQHLLSILHRAGLLVQLREISRQWRDQGLAKPSDDSVRMVGLAELRPGSIQRLTQLVQREGASLRDIIAGLEEAFSPVPGPPLEEQQEQQQRQRQPGQAEPGLEAAAGGSMAAAAGPSSSGGGAAAVAGFVGRPVVLRGAAEAEGQSDSEGGSDGGRVGRRRRGLTRSRRRGSRRTEREAEASGGRGRAEVDWTMLEAQRTLSLDPWGLSLSRSRRMRGRRSSSAAARRASSADGDVRGVLEGGQQGAGGGVARRRRQRSREAREQALSELIQSVHSVEGVLRSGARLDLGSAQQSAAAGAGAAGTPSRGAHSASAQPFPRSRSASAVREQSSSDSESSGSSSGGGSSSGPGAASSMSEPSGVAAPPPPQQQEPPQQPQQTGASPSSSGDGDGDAGAGGAAAAAAPATECCICLDAECDVQVSGCGHGICFVCACKMVARSSEFPTCPLCRGPISSFDTLVGGRRKQGQASAAAAALLAA